MQFKLAAKGTVTECREKLNAALATLSVPETQEQKVIRMIAHYIVAERLDPPHDKWARELQDARAANTPKAQGGLGASMEEPKEPRASFSVDCTIEFGA